MTGRDAERELLAAALVSFGIDYAQEASDALLPVVDRIANERTAAALEAAAEAAHDEYSGWEAAAVVRARAADLRASNGAGTTT